MCIRDSLSTLAVAILYALMSTIAAGVFPVSHVANEPLTLVAEEILPKPLYVFFIVGGAWAALISTLNSQLASCTKPLMQAANDGWIPAKLATLHKKYRTPIYLLTIFFFVGFFPIVFNLNISIISKIEMCIRDSSKTYYSFFWNYIFYKIKETTFFINIGRGFIKHNLI